MMIRMMTRFVSVAVACLLALAGVAVANGKGATTYRADLTPVNPAATTAGLATVVGKAQLVDGKKNNKASLHMRGLAADTTYLWHVHEGSCAATGAPVPGWTYRTQIGANGTLTSNAAGNANTKGKSATFNADPAKSYSVNVHVATDTNGLPAGTIIACGDLQKKP
jgi:Cu/Zn superoxide dismutase